jgi:hypothetical protein
VSKITSEHLGRAAFIYVRPLLSGVFRTNCTDVPVVKGLRAILRGVDLKLIAVSPILFRGGPAHELRKDAVLAANGLPALEHVRAGCRALPWRSFGANFPCTEQYRAMAFAQLTYRES